jgi:hypothetical protein
VARIGDLLIAAGLATDEQRTRAALIQRRESGRFGTALLEAGVPEPAIAWALSVQFDVAWAAAGELEEIRSDVLKLVPAKLAQRYAVVPFRREGRTLALAMKNPRDIPALDEISQITGLTVRPFAALEARIDAALSSHYGALVEPRHINATRLPNARRDAPVPNPLLTRLESSGARRRRSGAFRIVPAPPPDFGSSPAPTLSGGHPERSDPWAVVEGRGGAAALPQPAEPEIVDEAIDDETLPSSAGAPAAVAPEAPPPAPAPPGRGAPDPIPFDDLELDTPELSVEEILAARLTDARARDEVIDAVLAAAAHHATRAALFVVTGDEVAGWAARPEPPGDLRTFRLPLAEPSVFATLKNTEGYYVGSFMELPSTTRILKALGSAGSGSMAVVPITLKGRTVLYLWGESPSAENPPSVAALKRLAAMAATALEIVRLKKRLASL